MQSEDRLGIFTVNENVKSVGANDNKQTEIIAMDDHLFGVIYIDHTDSFAHSVFMKNGVPTTTSKLISNQRVANYITACRFENQIFTIQQAAFGSFNSNIFGQMIDTNGDTVDSLVSIETGFESQFTNCIQYSSNLIGIFYRSHGKETGTGITALNWDLYTRTYNPITQTLSATTLVNDYRDGFQGNSNVAKISNNKFIIVFDGQDYINIGGGKRQIYLQEFNNLGQKVNSNVIVDGTNTEGHFSPSIAGDSDGSFSVVWQHGSRTRYASYSSGNLATAFNCGFTLSSISTNLVTLVVHNGIAYIQYRRSDSKPYILELKTSDCSIVNDSYMQEDSDDSHNALEKMVVSDTSESTYLVFPRIFQSSGSEDHVKMIMYLLEQKAICNPNKCAGCNINYGTPNCPICAGSTKEERERRTTLDGTCSCQNGYYDDLVSKDCQQCSNRCQICTLSSCTVCDDGYYPDGTECTICPLHYQKCTAINTPTECKVGIQRGGLAVKCICNPGWVEQSGSVDCLQCTSPCKTCSTNQTTCDSCEDNYYLTVNTCTQCPLPFAKCTAIDTPTECKIGIQRGDLAAKCVCNPGWVEQSGQVDCLQCTSPCKACSTNQTTCDSCEDNYYLTGNTCTQCPFPFAECTAADTPTECKVGIQRGDLTAKCVCNPGWVEQSGQVDCLKCTSPCKTCSTNQTTCDSCEDNYYLNVNTCIQCPLPFAKCTGASSPTECKVGTGRLDHTQNCECDFSLGFVELSGQLNCVSCNSPCKTCRTDQDTCHSCEDNYYLNGTSCVQCPLPFVKCTASDSPTKCKVGIGRSTEISEKCTCKEGFYEISNQLNCKKCSFPCQSCQNSPLNCLSCLIKDGPGRNPLPDCTCQQGYFLMNLECQKCDNTVCGTCSLAADNCIQTCDSKCSTCDLSGNCISCKDGLFMDSGICKECSQQTCKKCNQDELCLQCKNPNLLPPQCQQTNEGTLVKEVLKPDGTSEIILSKCQSKCQQCQNNTETCTKCTYGSNRNSMLPCSCIIGFHDNNGTTQNCYQCPPQCKSCVSASTCTECIQKDLMKINNFSQTCSCISGYKFDMKQNICLKCYMYQGECLLVCPQNSKLDEKLNICQELNFIEQDFTSLIWICSGVVFAVLSVSSLFFHRKEFKSQRIAQKEHS